MEAIADLLTGREFLSGLLAGLVALGVAYALRHRTPDWALLWAGGVVAALWAGGLFQPDRGPGLARGPSTPALGVLAAIVVTLVAGYGLSKMQSLDVGAIAVLVSMGGIWATVPDTEDAAVLVGVTLGLVVAWWPSHWSAPRLVGAVALAALASWVAARGAVARETGLIGGLGSLMALGWSAVAIPSGRPWVWLAAHTVTVAVWSRWAGLMESSTAAIAVGVVASVVVAAIVRLIERAAVTRP